MPFNSQENLNKLKDHFISFGSSNSLLILNKNFKNVNRILNQGNKIYAMDDINKELFNHSSNKTSVYSSKYSHSSTQD